VVAELDDGDRREAKGTPAPAIKRATVLADVHGAFRIDALAPGRWRVKAKTAKGERSFAPSHVDATAGGAAEPITVSVFPTVALHGRLRVSVDAPAPSEVRSGESSAKVAGDGSFALEGLFAGPQWIAFHFETGHGGDPKTAWRTTRVTAPQNALDLDVASLAPDASADGSRAVAEDDAAIAAPVNGSAGACEFA